MSDNYNRSQEETPLTQDEKNMAMFCHLGAFSGVLIPFGNIIVPLIIWLTKKEDSEFVNYHGKESLNFQITMAIAFIISFILVFVIIGIFLLIGLGIFELVVIIIASIKASEGKPYNYPFSIKFIK